MTDITVLPKAVFFDWDGTLVNSLPFLFKAHNHVREVLGHKIWDMDEYKVHMILSARELYAKIYEDPQGAMKILYSFVDDHHLNELQIMPMADELLTLLESKRIPIGVVSNKRHEYLEKEIRHIGWEDRLSAIVGAGKAEKDKPAADPLLLALEQSGLAAHKADIWYIGDTETDLLLSQNTGCPGIFLLNGEDKSELVSNYTPFIVANDCGEIHKIITGL